VNSLVTKRIYLLSLLFLIGGCAGTLTGPTFHAITGVAQDKAVIYMYRNDDQNASSRADFSIKVNDKSVAVMKNTGYCSMIVPPGPMNITAKVKFKAFATGLADIATNPATSVALNAEAGGVYYIECVGRRNLPLDAIKMELDMKIVPNEAGTSKIAGCHLLGEYTILN
jgi:hypothetical protein